MGARDLSRALIAAWLAGAPLAAQQALPEQLDRAAWAAHESCVASERALRFLVHYQAATPELRARAAQLLERARPPAAGVAWVPSIGALRTAESVLADAAGRDDAALAELDTLGGALDLVVVPGVFEVRSEGLGDALTIHVRRVVPITADKEFVLSLEWRALDGSEIHARREPVGPDALSPTGFEMYVRAPLSPAAPWTLRGMVGSRATGELAGGVPEVRVDAIEDLRTRARAALEKTFPDQPGLDHLRRAFDRLLRSGRRLSTSLSGGEILGAIEAWSEHGPPAGLPVPLELVFSDTQYVEHWLWTHSAVPEPRRALVLLAPLSETPDFVFSGALGAAWEEVARRRGAQLFALHLPPEPARIAPLLQRLRAWVDDRELVVVARGESLGRLELGLVGLEQLPFDALAIAGGGNAAALAALHPALPRLIVAPGASALHVERCTCVDGPALTVLGDLELAAHVDRWLAELDAAHAERKSER